MNGSRTALVVGLGRSGRAAARLLAHQGWTVRGYDRNAPGADPGFPCVASETPGAEAFAGVELVVLSPGVPPGPIREAAARHAPHARITGELALGLDHVQGSGNARPKTVLVTGTNGKSTVTALTGALLEAGGLETFTGGNLGVPLCEMLAEVLDGVRAWPGALVLECSSFQLETFEGFPTDVAMILNVTPDHLDRYDDELHYARTKTNIFRGQGDGSLALVGPDVDPGGAHARVVDPRAQLDGADLRSRSAETFPRSLLRIAGQHNAINAVFAVEAALHLGVAPDHVRQGLAGFTGLPHRMQLVAEIDGVAYYDDSKATNVASVAAGLAGFDRPFVLIYGGRAKGDDPGPLLAMLAGRGVPVVGMGESGPGFVGDYAAMSGAGPTDRAGGMDDAVRKATALAKPGEAVILSPGGSSFDMFRNYAERGDAFVAAVQALRGTD